MHVTTVCFKHNSHWLLSRVQGCCLEPKWQWPFWHSAAPFRISSCIHPIDGVALQTPQPPMDGSQLVQWLSVQAGNMAGDLQHNVRALMVRASSPMPVSDGRDEVSSLRKQLRHQLVSNKLIENYRLCYRTKLWQLKLSRVNGRWQVKRHMPL